MKIRTAAIVVGILALCFAGGVSAEVSKDVALDNARPVTSDDVRVHGTLGGLTATLSQTGSLQANVAVSVSTAGGYSFTSLEGILLYGQVYDTPWIGPCTGTDVPGVDCNEFIDGSTTILQGVTGGPYSDSWTFTVPAEDTYQAWGLAFAGWYPYPPFGTYSSGFWYSQVATTPGNTMFIQQATPTPDPNAGGDPIPTVGSVGMISMILLLAGVAILVLIRRK